MTLSVDAEIVVRLAVSEAMQRRQDECTVEHVLYALCFDPSIAESLRRAGADVPRLKDTLRRRLHVRPAPPTQEVPDMSSELEAALGWAGRHAQGEQSTLVAPFDVLLGVLSRRETGAAAIFTECTGLGPKDLSSRGFSTDERASGAGAVEDGACVIIHDDEATTQEFVVDVLVRLFEKEPPEANYVMLRVHHKKRAVAGYYPKQVALEKAESTIVEARKNGFPLRVTVEPGCASKVK